MDEARAYVGGQAVIGGVMMRTRTAWAVAVRLPDGGLDAVRDATPTWPRRWDRVPVARGVVALLETISLGLRALQWSAARERQEVHGEASRATLVATTVVALVLFTAVFAVLPAALATAAEPLVGEGLGFTVAEAAFRLALFLGYIVGIGFSPGIRETFAYHGAEHMMIAAFEAGDPLTPEAARRHSRHHARCGTDFLLLVVLVAIVVFSFVPPAGFWWTVASRVVLLPLAAGLAYEVLRLSRRFPGSRVVRLAVAPGLALQHITTREPTDAQLEVAALALTTATAEGSRPESAR